MQGFQVELVDLQSYADDDGALNWSFDIPRRYPPLTNFKCQIWNTVAIVSLLNLHSACTYIIYMMLQNSDGWKEPLF